MAALIGRLPCEVIASFQDSEPDRRVARLNDVTGDISLGMAPVINWLERRRPADTAELVKRRLCRVLDEAVLCAGHEIPEYAGGKVSRGGEVRSVGALRTATLVAAVKPFEQSLLGWANDIEAEESQRSQILPSSSDHALGRLRFDPLTQTVYLDGAAIPVEDPKAFLLYKTLAEHEGPLTRRALRSKSGHFRGDKTVPRLRLRLPTRLRNTVRSNNTGYWLRLPPKKKSANDRA
jgi:hypothetical protein